ncbi:MAG: TonB-dependent receptor [Bacteroidales bacterium]|nr:TonB-dependent receptor [Bacteroidales bacterium]
MFRKSILIIIFSVLTFQPVVAQQAWQAWIEGHLKTAEGEPLQFVNIAIEGTSIGTTTDINGYFTLSVPVNEVFRLRVSHLGFLPRSIPLVLVANERRYMEITLEASPTQLPDIEVTGRQILSTDITRLDPRHTATLPGPTAGVEGLIHTLPGVSTTTELSSQYSVRGGNFDENLVYVNGIEIYRPFLVRSGQQEGLSFLNPSLVASIEFSSGGFNAMYGDKMASVLDITYATPEKFAGSFSLSLLEGSVHVEGISGDNKLSYLVGARYKSNQYLLGTLDTQGDYKPSFSDLQGLVNYRFSDEWQLSFLGNYNDNRYQFIPDVQRTRFGTITEVREFTVFFDGQEVNRFTTAMGALSLQYDPGSDFSMQLITSIFQSDERENFDILGQYWLQRVETDMGQDDFGQPTGEPLGVGTFLNHARNYLNAIVWNAELKGHHTSNGNQLKWGVKFQHEDIFDRLSEWSLIDSAGYSLPRQPDHLLLLQDTLNTRIGIQSNRVSAYIQNTWEFLRPHGRFALTAGVRSNYWNFNNQLIFSPRSTLLYKPEWMERWTFRASAGFYHQPPFYRELRNLQGELNENIKAQESIHLVLGSSFNFTAWNRPFQYTTELYYKILNNLIPYEIENLRIRYYADNISKGYAAGLDMKIHGEFVPGIDSWASLSLMQTREKIEDTFLTGPDGTLIPAGYIPRPTDQRFNFSIFFQDFLPRNPSYQVHLGLFYGSGLPFWAPTRDRRRDTGRMPPYQRVDIGFSAQLIGAHTTLPDSNPFRHFESLWITAEVFNLLEISNTISYYWIKDVENQLFAIPNYLTSRLINLKLIARF